MELVHRIIRVENIVHRLDSRFFKKRNGEVEIYFIDDEGEIIDLYSLNTFGGPIYQFKSKFNPIKNHDFRNLKQTKIYLIKTLKELVRDRESSGLNVSDILINVFSGEHALIYDIIDPGEFSKEILICD